MLEDIVADVVIKAGVIGHQNGMIIPASITNIDERKYSKLSITTKRLMGSYFHWTYRFQGSRQTNKFPRKAKGIQEASQPWSKEARYVGMPNSECFTP